MRGPCYITINFLTLFGKKPLPMQHISKIDPRHARSKTTKFRMKYFQYFTLPHVVRADSEDSPRTVRAVRGQSEQSEDSPSSPRTVRGQSEDSPRTVRAVLVKHYFLFCSDSARTVLGLC